MSWFWQPLPVVLPSNTRFYLPSSGAAAVSPAFDAGWEETGDADRLKMVTTKIASSMTDKSITTIVTAGDALVRQYVSDSLVAQTIDTNIRLYARSSEALGTVDAVSKIVLKVVSSDGGTVRGTLLAISDYGGGAEFNTSLRNKSFADGDIPSSVAAQAGDRLVLEIGFNHAAVISSAAINFGDDSATDLVQDEIATAANNPWLEVGQVLVFQAGTLYTQSVSGGITPTGTLTKQPAKVLVGLISTLVGILLKQAQKNVSGTVSSIVGTLIKSTNKSFSGENTPIGTLAKQPQKVLIGVISSIVGTLIKSTNKLVSGESTSIGTLTKQSNKDLTGSNTPIGTLSKQTSKSFSGAVSSIVGTLETIRLAIVSIGGSITPTGTLIKQVSKFLIGSITPTGNVNKQTNKSFAGSITPSGTLSKSTFKSLSGTVSSIVGSVIRQTNKIIAGSVVSSGTIIKRINKSLSGAISSIVGLLTRLLNSGAPPTEPTTVHYIYVIPAENRSYKIPSENRTYIVPDDSSE